ncbi:MAG: Gfo/Idh/MocA family oxidoreductase [Verrucomicrobiota bacterium]|nr:Gfo/Idh/MocA family oxidoreductase [Verrucomicrobiota bacterium]
MNRRQFLQKGASALALTSLASSFPAFAASDGKPLRVGLIGTGWYGKCDLLRLLQVTPAEVVSLCDVDRRMLNNAADIVAGRQESGNRPRTYHDYREMLAEKDLDLVLVATPDHWHALPMIEAVKAGADVYVQKPISIDVEEGRAMLAAARKHERVVQVGTQRRSTPHLIDAKDKVIKEGLLGDIAFVEIYCYYHMRTRGNPPAQEPPEHLDWEMWTGPAPMRTFHGVAHPRGWRSFTEYSNGIVGDMCIHMLDMVRWLLDLGWPTRVASTGGILVDTASIATIPDTQNATFDFQDLQVVWQHRTWGSTPDPAYPWGATIYGSKGTLKASVNQWDFIPQGGGQPMHQDVVFELEEYPVDKTEPDLEKHVAPAIRRHMLDLLEARANRSRPIADIEEGFISTTSCILANLALQLGRTLQYDPETGTVLNDPEATRLLKRPYRAPWTHPSEA